MTYPKVRKPRKPLSIKQIAYIKWLLLTGQYHQHEIAALVGTNQGRVSEVNTGQRGAGINPAPFPV